jgi:hypothetical protein
MTGNGALSKKLIEFGALLTAAGRRRSPRPHAMACTSTHSCFSWKKDGDRTDNLQVFETYNYFYHAPEGQLARQWRCGRELNMQNNMQNMNLMRVALRSAQSYRAICPPPALRYLYLCRCLLGKAYRGSLVGLELLLFARKNSEL